MPITARKPRECFQQFEDHLGQLMAATVAKTHHLAPISRYGKTLVKVSFRENGAVAVPIKKRGTGASTST